MIDIKDKNLINQFGRFVIIGLINTGLNFAILNLLSIIFHITKGERVIWIAAIAFAIATANSFYWNKHWTFKDETHDHGQELTLFLIISVIGVGINSLIVYLITSHLDPLFGISDRLWLNLANALATGVSMVWNFLGYRNFVFRSR